MVLGGPLWMFMYVGTLFFWPAIYIYLYCFAIFSYSSET